jgi:Na+/melibiose symporter-like transporter
MTALRKIRRRVFPETMGRQLLAGALLPLCFIVPVLVVQLFWPDADGANEWKVVAVFLGAVIFCLMMGFFKYFSVLLTIQESNETEGASDT